MAYEYLAVGTQRFTQQGFLGTTNPNYAIKLYNVVAGGATPNSEVRINLMTGTGANLTTATGGAAYLILPLTTSGTSMTNSWDSHYGVLIDGPVLVQTAAAGTFVVVGYQQILK